MIKYYYPYQDYNKHDTLINNIIFNSDYDCLRCGKTNPVTQHPCIGCGCRNVEVLNLLGKFSQIDEKIKILRSKPVLKEFHIDEVSNIRKIVNYPGLKARGLEFLQVPVSNSWD